MTTDKLNGFLTLEHLSDIELYYTPAELVRENKIILKNEEFHHCVNVMRNSIGDMLYITSGIGIIYSANVQSIRNKELTADIIDKKEFENKSSNIWFCIPLLKNSDRIKFALEKCVELGITNFILFTSNRTISKKTNPEKFQKTLLTAMKQSIRSFLPKLAGSDFQEVIKNEGTIFLFDQKTENKFVRLKNLSGKIYFIFGPEGGFDNEELELIETSNRFSLSSNRLRSETAIIKCASILNLP